MYSPGAVTTRNLTYRHSFELWWAVIFLQQEEYASVPVLVSPCFRPKGEICCFEILVEQAILVSFPASRL